MSQSRTRTIKDYFKRPAFAQDTKYILPSSSPLSDPPSDLPSHFASPQKLPDAHVEPEPKDTLSRSSDAPSPNHSAQPSHGCTATFRRSSSLGGSFSSSQRILKNGQEVILDSDAESVDSIDSLETADDLLDKFLNFSSKKQVTEPPASSLGPSTKPGNRKNKNSRNFRALSEFREQKYRFSMASLVTSAVDDNEAEATVAKAKALLQGHDTTSHNEPEAEVSGANLRKDVLASALSTNDQETDFQRLLNAVKRTEAFEQEKSWSFFGDQLIQERPEFPRDSIDPSSGESFLREAFTRDRAFYSGIVDFALSNGRLPDEFFIWIFHSVPSEPRDELRYAYCRAIKHAEAQRVESLLGPEDVEQAFLSLGGSPTAMSLSEPMRPEILDSPASGSRNWKFLLSLLDLLTNIASHLRVDTKVYTLQILFRLAMDTVLANSNLGIAALESTINSLLLSIPDEEFEQIMQPISKSVFKAINDTTFQSRLLGHILPTIPQIALFRCRLAMAFLANDASQLDKPSEELLNLRQVIAHLKDSRLDVKLHKSRLASDYDYNELKAITSLLNIVIDTGRTTLEFPDKQSERQFNADVDALADQVKRIFSAIEDSGASHLKRTEAKQGLEALRYRIIYSVRSRPRIKSLFGHEDGEGPRAVMHKWFDKGEKQKRIKRESPVA